MGVEFHLECLKACWHDEGYVSIAFARSARVSARAVMELNGWVLAQTEAAPVLRILVDVRDLGPIDADVIPAAVRYYFETRGRRGTPRVAFIARDVLPRTVSSFLALSRAPARTFADVEAARQWLLAAEARAGLP